MDVSPVPRIEGALLFRPTPHVGERGFLARFGAEVVRAAGIDTAAFAQHNLSRSVRGMLRGLHVRRGDGKAKPVRCSYGGDLRRCGEPASRLADDPDLAVSWPLPATVQSPPDRLAPPLADAMKLLAKAA